MKKESESYLSAQIHGNLDRFRTMLKYEEACEICLEIGNSGASSCRFLNTNSAQMYRVLTQIHVCLLPKLLPQVLKAFIVIGSRFARILPGEETCQGLPELQFPLSQSRVSEQAQFIAKSTEKKENQRWKVNDCMHSMCLVVL